MKKTTIATHFALSLVLALGLAPDARACGAADVCTDVTASFVGGVITSDGIAPGLKRVRLQWWSDQELVGGVITSDGIRAYRVSRCSSPTDCSWLAMLRPAGACGALQVYEVTDQPPAPVDAWTYTLQVVRADGAVACSVSSVPR